MAGIQGKKLAALLITGWVLVGVAAGLRLNQGWVPHDDGSFAQSAHRVLQGELPHRDFAELYTGGLTFLNAAVFWIFGENLIWLRLPLFIAFLASVPCVYYIARRFVPPLGAGLVTVAASAWGFPAYPAAVPSWYVLFLAIGGCAALFRYLEVSRARWLFIAGLLGGMSISVKIVGVYYVLAALCFLTFVDQRRALGAEAPIASAGSSRMRSRAVRFRRDLRRAPQAIRGAGAGQFRCSGARGHALRDCRRGEYDCFGRPAVACAGEPSSCCRSSSAFSFRSRSSRLPSSRQGAWGTSCEAS